MKILPDLMLLSGAGAMAYGAWLVYEPAGFLLGGFLAVLWGVIASRAAG